LASKILFRLAQIKFVHHCILFKFNSWLSYSRPLYYDLRKLFSERIDDKADWAIREQASVALCTFHRVDDPTELSERNLPQLSEVLVEKLGCDSKEYVPIPIA
jgi:hypothetical protein